MTKLNRAIKDHDKYISLKPQVDIKSTELLNGLLSCNVETIDRTEGIKAIRFGNGYTLPDVSIRPDTLYVRSCFPSMLEFSRKYLYSIILSNPGNGMSMFVLYYLARIVNPSAFPDNPILLNFFYDNSSPLAIILQVDRSDMTVLFPNERIAHKVPCNAETLKCFSLKGTMYLYTHKDNDIGPFDSNLLPMLATKSPMREEPIKNGLWRVHLPLCTLEELTIIGRDIRAKPNTLPDDVKNVYDDLSIESRYNEFGGVFSHVLPSSQEVIANVLKKRNEMTNSFDFRKIYSKDLFTVESLYGNPFIFTFDVDNNFNRKEVKYINATTEKLASTAMRNLNLEQLVEMLKLHDKETGL